MLLGLCLNPDRSALCFEHLQPLFLIQDLNKVVTLGCDLFNGLECFASLPLENHQPLQSALLEHMQETLTTSKHTRGNISCLQPAQIKP